MFQLSAGPSTFIVLVLVVIHLPDRQALLLCDSDSDSPDIVSYRTDVEHLITDVDLANRMLEARDWKVHRWEYELRHDLKRLSVTDKVEVTHLLKRGGTVRKKTQQEKEAFQFLAHLDELPKPERPKAPGNRGAAARRPRRRGAAEESDDGDDNGDAEAQGPADLDESEDEDLRAALERVACSMSFYPGRSADKACSLCEINSSARSCPKYSTCVLVGLACLCACATRPCQGKQHLRARVAPQAFARAG